MPASSCDVLPAERRLGSPKSSVFANAILPNDTNTLVYLRNNVLSYTRHLSQILTADSLANLGLSGLLRG